MDIANAQQMREIDRRAIEEWGIPGMVLMENAAKAVVSEITKRLRDQASILILAGKGNNGGDGLAIARHLRVLGHAPVVYLFAAPQDLTGDALHNYSLYIKMDGKLREVRSDIHGQETYQEFCQDLWRSAVVVDALYGTGFSGELPLWIRSYTEHVNSVHTTLWDTVSAQFAHTTLSDTTSLPPGHTILSHTAHPPVSHTASPPLSHTASLPLSTIGSPHAIPALSEAAVSRAASLPLIVAVDIPSGLEAQSGRAAEGALKAHLTVAFGLPKLGHILNQGPAYTGQLVVDRISLPDHVIEAQKIHTHLLTADRVRKFLPQRPREGHKGTHGCGLLVGGSAGMSGAVILAGRGALRSGIGLVQIVSPAGIAPLVDAGLTEATVWSADPPADTLSGSAAGNTLDTHSWDVIAERLSHAQACAVGPGLKQPPGFTEVLYRLLEKSRVPLVLDADALNLLAANMDMLERRQALGPENCTLILTPHPGEMSRLCQISIADVQARRLDLAVCKAREWNAVVILKGANTLVASPSGSLALNTTGNSGLGTGGTGDVLTGSLLAWLAQGVPPFQAACLAVYLHGRSADHLSAMHGPFGFTAGEVADGLCRAQQELMCLASPRLALRKNISQVHSCL